METIDDESLPFTVFSVLAAGVTGDVPKRSHNTGSTTIRSWRIAGWTQTFQKCPLPESNESSSHYDLSGIDTLPLSQRDNHQFFGN